MKTPEEIKKGLECCQPRYENDHWVTCNSDCPYQPDAPLCHKALVAGALAYIQQLEDAIYKTTQLMQSATEVIKKSQEQLESTYSQVKKALCGKENVSLVEVLEAADQLKSRLAQVERERDAAVSDLKLVGCCGTCINNDGGCTTECYIVSGKLTGWQWRGVCPENTKED